MAKRVEVPCIVRHYGFVEGFATLRITLMNLRITENRILCKLYFILCFVYYLSKTLLTCIEHIVGQLTIR